MKNSKKIIYIFMISLFLVSNIQAQEKQKMNEARAEYQHENYEEAIVSFEDLRAKHPDSSPIAYYLGLTYKKLQDYKKARPHFEAAYALNDSNDNALLELIDVLYQTGENEEALKWIEVAEKKSIKPAQIAFFKGLVLLKKGDQAEKAIESFNKAEELDESLAGSVKYYRGFAFLQLEENKKAKGYLLKAHRLFMALDDSALDAISGLDPEFATFDEIADVLQRRFDPAEKARVYRSELKQRRRGVDESPADYAAALRRLSRKAFPNFP